MVEDDSHPLSLRKLGLIAGTPERALAIARWQKVYDDAEADGMYSDEDKATLEPPGETLELPGEVDLAALLAGEVHEEWAAEPIFPLRRAILLLGAAKAGKSDILLAAAVAVATGGTIFGVRCQQRRVLYVDAEMTADDLRERLHDLGHTDDEALKGWFWIHQGPQTPLDFIDGAQAVIDKAHKVGAEIVVLDTWRALASGEENDSTLVRSWYRRIVAPLKHEGISTWTGHHLGKDTTRGGRGSSDFSGWPDVVWEVTRGEGTFTTLKATHRRVGWVEESVTVERRGEPVEWVRTGQMWSAGTKDLAARLEVLGVAADQPLRSVLALLQAAGQGARRALVAEAQRWRRSQLTTRNSDEEGW